MHEAPILRRAWSYAVAPSGELGGDSGSVLSLSTRMAVLVVGYLLVERWIFAVGTLAENSYERSIVAVGVIESFTRAKAVVPLLAIVALAILRPMWLRWDDLEHGRWVRLFVFVPTAVLAWTYSTYDFNAYLAQSHALDRLLLCALAVLTWFRPIFVLPFTGLTIAMVGQFRFPFPAHSLTQPYLLIRLLILFIAMFLLLVVSRRRNAVDYVFCAIAMLSASYFVAGVGKARLDWMSYGHLYHALPTTYTNGWLAFLEPGELTRLTRAVSTFDWPMRAVGFALECGAVIFFWRRSVAIVLVSGWAVFHLGVFLISGICFWMWIALDVGLLLFLSRRELAGKFAFFNPARCVVASVLIAFGSWWFDSVNLAWYDARSSYTYVFEAVDANGENHRLGPQFFAPFETPFTMGSFSYLVDEPVLPIVWGATFDRRVAEELLECRDAGEIFALERERGYLRFNIERTEQLDQFVATFIRNVEARKAKNGWWRVLRAPSQTWSLTPTSSFWREDVPVRRVIVRQLMSDWNGAAYAVIRDRVVHEIDLS